VRRGKAASEPELGVRAVNPCDTCIRDERRPAASRDQVAKVLERADLDVHTACGEDDVVGVGGPRVRRLFVERKALRVKLPERGFDRRKRALRPLRALPRDARIDLDEHGERPRSQRVADRCRRDRTAAEGDHDRSRRGEDLRRNLLLPRAEDLLPERERKQICDPRPLAPFDFLVGVHERPLETPRDLGADGRLAGAHESDQRDVAVGYRGDHGMRST
jgi:hypothetical protein